MDNLKGKILTVERKESDFYEKVLYSKKIVKFTEMVFSCCWSSSSLS